MDATPHMPPPEPVFRKEKGWRHLFAAARYSLQGLGRLWQEAAFRHEVLAFCVGLGLLLVVGAPFAHLLVFTVLMLLLFSVEALNTAMRNWWTAFRRKFPPWAATPRISAPLPSSAC